MARPLRGWLIRPTWHRCPHCYQMVATPGLTGRPWVLYFSSATAMSGSAGATLTAQGLPWIGGALLAVMAGHIGLSIHMTRMPRGVDLRPVPGDTLSTWSTAPAATAPAAGSPALRQGDCPAPGSAGRAVRGPWRRRSPR